MRQTHRAAITTLTHTIISISTIRTFPQHIHLYIVCREIAFHCRHCIHYYSQCVFCVCEEIDGALSIYSRNEFLLNVLLTQIFLSLWFFTATVVTRRAHSILLSWFLLEIVFISVCFVYYSVEDRVARSYIYTIITIHLL